MPVPKEGIEDVTTHSAEGITATKFDLGCCVLVLKDFQAANLSKCELIK